MIFSGRQLIDGIVNAGPGNRLDSVCFSIFEEGVGFYEFSIGLCFPVGTGELSPKGLHNIAKGSALELLCAIELSSPERATQSTIACVALSGLGGIYEPNFPRALPFAMLCEPVGLMMCRG